MRTIWFALVALLFVACTLDRKDADYDNPYDPARSSGIAAPESVRVVVGDASVQLSWRMPPGETADEYTVLRKTPDVETEKEEKIVATVSAPEYRDSRVRNGRLYVYRIAAGREGRFGERTAELEARPALCAITIEQDHPFTRERSVTVAHTAVNAVAIRLGDDPAAFTSPWHSITDVLKWELRGEDGEKAVYAELRFEDGSTSEPVSDAIVLDTKAVVRSVAFEGSAVRRIGEQIHFLLDAGEAEGTASITVEGLFQQRSLFDDGTGGDRVAGDGVYEADCILSTRDPLTRIAVKGAFTDRAGNAATETQAADLLTVQPPLEPVSLLSTEFAEPPDAAAITVRWSRFAGTGFASYKVYRAAVADVDSTSRLVASIENENSLEAKDSHVVEGESYFYRVYVQDDGGSSIGSNVYEVSVPNLREPTAVRLESGSTAGPNEIAIQWSRCADTDFHAYRLYRGTEGAVDETDRLLLETTEAGTVLFVDSGLTENTPYSYRVYTVDEGGLKTPSNEVEIKTDNEEPLAVVLNEATEVDTSAATLRWSRSDAHDFAHYRLYRDITPTVSTGSTEVVEIDEAASTEFRDVELEKSTRYYYRVFVFDDAADPKSTGSNTITIVTTR